ncbi:Alpha-2-macroglobulin MG1 domain [Leclercia adecarboxylata]|uniref:Alpha-2-macroglobulin MG1 domain n=1 Tax=Leclercia adecarboxylata TaxID=83655 RepID=A0A4U9IEA6_9ENTR|nr:Alpha-2-macroglobulin MG1 domain [Leclercia adecarboxylata]
MVDDVGTQVSLTSGQLTNDARPTLNGTAEAGATVNVYDGDRLLGSVVADANNAWSFTPTTPLADGQHTLTVTATDAVGNVSLPTAGFNLNLDATARARLSSPRWWMTSARFRVRYSMAIRLTTTVRPSTAQPKAGATVRIYDGTTLVGEVTANAQGQWTLAQTTTTLTDGVHNFTATATDAAGNLSAASPVTSITGRYRSAGCAGRLHRA